MERLRVVSWNLQRAFASAGRAADQVAELRALRADVLLLQESPTLRAELDDEFWWHRETTAAGWGAAVALRRAKFPSWEARPNPKPYRKGRLAIVRAAFAGREISIISVHPQARSSETSRASAASGWIVDLNEHLQDEPAIIGGDWNTGRPVLNSFFPRAAEAGWYECAQTTPEVATHLHPRRAGAASEHVLDHVFCRKLAVTHETRVLASPRIDELSDHRPLMVELDVWPPGGASVDQPAGQDEFAQ